MRQKTHGVILGSSNIVYARVSMETQDSARQVHDCLNYCEKNGIVVTRTVEESVSSKKKNRAIITIINELKKGDSIIVTELSRLSRSLIELSGLIASIINAGASIHVAGSNRVIDGGVESQTYVFAWGLAAQIERDLISERTKSGLRARAAAGVKLGRPRGTRKAAQAIAEKGIDPKIIDTMINARVSMACIARMLGVNSRTVKRYWEERP